MKTDAVFCRRNQLREAAIVLSCMPGTARGPLVVLDPPPNSVAEYAKLYAAYRATADARDLVRASERMPDVAATQAASEKLTPYRSWVKRQIFIAELLARVAPGRAIFLFAPSAEDISYIEPMPMSRIDLQPISIVPESTARHVFAPWASLAAFATNAWTFFRGSEAEANAPIDVCETSLSQYVMGLYHAFENDAPLRPVATKSTVKSDTFCDPSGGIASEAVLVETADDAERLLGVIYARARNARLVVCAEPDADAIEAARLAVERRHAAPIVAQGATEDDRVASLRTALFGDDASEVLLGLERAVSSAIEPAAIAAVGELPVTAFTTNTPYNFVARDGVSWAEKPIGHVTGDPTAIVLSELYRTPSLSDAGFSMLLDPGYIATNETSGVLDDLTRGGTYTLELRGDATAMFTVEQLTRMLPIDLIFFNTHGSEKGILLAGLPEPLSGYKIAQYTNLKNRPFVFNNSCQSWVGVGREFVRVGARGYVGTLWSVHESNAAPFARNAIGRMMAGEPLAAALRRTPVPAADARAYIYVGTVGATMREEAPSTPAGLADRRLGIAQFLLHAANALLDIPTIDIGMRYVRACIETLVAQSEAILQAYDSAASDVSNERIAAALTQMRIYAALVVVAPNDPKPHAFFAVWLNLIESGANETAKRAARAWLLLYASRIYARLGPWRQVVAMLDASIADFIAVGEPPVRGYLERADALMCGGHFAAATASLASALQIHANDASVLDTDFTSREAKIALGTGDARGALAIATSGIASADARDDFPARAVAMIDAANAYLATNDYANALTSAREALVRAGLAYEPEGKLYAAEVLARALVANDILDEAKTVLETHLALAVERDLTLANAALLAAFGDMALRRNEATRAVGVWCNAARLFAKVGRPVREQELLMKVRQAVPICDSLEASMSLLRLELAIVDDLEQPVRAMVAGEFAGLFGALVANVAPQQRASLATVLTEVRAFLARPGTTIGDERKAMIATVEAVFP